MLQITKRCDSNHKRDGGNVVVKIEFAESLIGLPTLNGLDAARQIRKIVPQSKIIFVTQEFSPDIVQEAVGLGASGYVLKSKIQRDLLAAVITVLEGKQFVSSELSG